MVVLGIVSDHAPAYSPQQMSQMPGNARLINVPGHYRHQSKYCDAYLPTSHLTMGSSVCLIMLGYANTVRLRHPAVVQLALTV